MVTLQHILVCAGVSANRRIGTFFCAAGCVVAGCHGGPLTEFREHTAYLKNLLERSNALLSARYDERRGSVVYSLYVWKVVRKGRAS